MSPAGAEAVRAWRPPDVHEAYAERDAILYALGVGLGWEPADPGQLRFVWERDLVVLPTFATVLGRPAPFWTSPCVGPAWAGVVHGEHALVVDRPLAPSGRVVSANRVEAVVDRGPGRGARVLVVRETRDARTGARLAWQRATLVCRDAGGLGSVPHGAGAPPVGQAVPDRPPDAVAAHPTMPQAALVYRLSGDRNPLHVDPAAARRHGFDRPVLHGLCTFGIAAHAVLAAGGPAAPEALRRIEARFSGAVFPGDVVATDIWCLGGGRVAFRCRVAARGATVVDRGVAELETRR